MPRRVILRIDNSFTPGPSRRGVVNTFSGQAEDRCMVTGMHTVSDIFCRTCLHYVGWVYLHAFEASQKYKEGKFILERDKIEDRGPRCVFSF